MVFTEDYPASLGHQSWLSMRGSERDSAGVWLQGEAGARQQLSGECVRQGLRGRVSWARSFSLTAQSFTREMEIKVLFPDHLPYAWYLSGPLLMSKAFGANNISGLQVRRVIAVIGFSLSFLPGKTLNNCDYQSLSTFNKDSSLHHSLYTGRKKKIAPWKGLERFLTGGKRLLTQLQWIFQNWKESKSFL